MSFVFALIAVVHDADIAAQHQFTGYALTSLALAVTLALCLGVAKRVHRTRNRL